MAEYSQPVHLVPYTDEETSPGREPYREDVVAPYRDDTEDENEQSFEHPLRAEYPKRRSSKLLKFLACVGLVILIVGFVLLLASRPRYRHRGSSSKPEQPNRGHKQQKAVAYRLDFPALYPDITSPRGSQCHQAWNTLVAIPCHDNLFDRGNDNGTFRLMGPDPMYFIPKDCDSRCRPALEEAYDQLSSSCSTFDTFVLEGYKGTFNTSLLERGPAEAVGTLLRRNQHVCRKSPNGDSDYEYCPIEMFERFTIVDGMNANNLNGIESFIHETNKKRVEPATRKRGRKGTSKYSYKYDYLVRQQSYGPGVGETSCGWCTFDFLNRTLNAWSEGSVLSPDSKQPVSLPEYIRRVRAAGQRCAPSSTWTKMYDEAVSRYRSAGLIPEDWEKTLPSGDLYFLIRNGPSEGDAPVSDIYAELDRLSSLRDDKNTDFDPKVLSNSKVCLSSLANQYTSAKCYINLSNESLTMMLEKKPNLDNSLSSRYCSRQCSEAIETWSSVSSCDAANANVIPTAQGFLEDYSNAVQTRQRYCRLASDKSYEYNCPKALLSLGKAEWAFDGRPSTPDLVSDISTALEELKGKPIPESIRTALENKQGAPTSNDARRAYLEWKREIGESVCAGCIWTLLVGRTSSEMVDYMSSASSPGSFVEFVKKYHSTCSSLGATWLGGEPFGDDPVIWRVKEYDGAVVRYIYAGKPEYKSDRTVYGVNEANGKAFIGRDMKNPEATLWHVLQAERQLEATRQGRFDEWKKDEEEHRKEADKSIWEVNRWGSPRYIGPKYGFGKKKQEE